jgi:hypothetical protein
MVGGAMIRLTKQETLFRRSTVQAYHGTPNGNFEKFDTFPVFLTDDYQAARAYAENNFSRDDSGWPVVMTVSFEFKKPKVINHSELIDLIGEDGVLEWSNLDNLVWEYESQGYDGLILEKVPDFYGMEGEVRIERFYTQYILLNESYEVVNR